MRLADKSREYREKEGRVSIIMVVVNFEGSNDETYRFSFGCLCVYTLDLFKCL